MTMILRRIIISLLILALCTGAAIAGRLLSAGPGNGPSAAHELIAAARLPRAAAVLAAYVPVYSAPPPLGGLRGLIFPWRVGVQAGHWKIGELPDEQAGLRRDTGAQWGSLMEANVNLPIARAVVARLREAGVDAQLLPAAVPEGYDADAFVAIHTDSGRGAESGFKVAAPWRSSEASRKLRDEIAHAYADSTGMRVDRYGVSFNMRGYYAFSWTRYAHAVAPSTPAAIIETGFLTSAADRRIVVDDPERAARGIADGIMAYLVDRAGMRASSLVPVALSPAVVATDRAALRYYPGENERVAATLPEGTIVRPVNEENGWVELIVRGDFRLFGWVRKSDLQDLGG